MRTKGRLGRPKRYFVTFKSSEDLQKISLRSERALGVPKEMFLLFPMVMGKQKRPWRDQKEQGRPKRDIEDVRYLEAVER